MLVLAQVSSIKTRCDASSLLWYFFHCSRRLATSGRSCSEACKLFFEADAFVVEQTPHRTVARRNAAFLQLGNELAQRQVGFSAIARQIQSRCIASERR